MTSEHDEHGSSHDSESREVQDRLLLPLLVPLGIFLFAVLVIYGLSRIYLDLNHRAIGDVTMATPLALGISIIILGLAWYFASAKEISRWQVGAAVGVAALLLTGGAIAAAVVDEPEPEVHNGPLVDGQTPGPPGQLVIEMDDNVFLVNGEENPTVPVQPGRPVEIELMNIGRATHNVHVAGPGGTFAVDFCESGGEAPCSDPSAITGGESGTLTLNFGAPGEFPFRCDFHPDIMTGTIAVQ